MKTKLLLLFIVTITLNTFGQFELLLNIDTDEGRRRINILGDYNNELLFSVQNTSFQTHLYTYKNGAINEVKDANGNSILNPLVSVEKDNKLFFNARVNNVIGGFTYDGSTITNFTENSFFSPIIYKNKIYFDSPVREGIVNKYYLHVTEGTAESTSIFKEVETLKLSGTHRYRKIVAGEYLFFTAHTDDDGVELWRTDGTDAGTIMLKDINPGSGHSEVTNFFVASNGLLYFQAKDGVHGEELWVSDGTSEGTIMLKDFYEGAVGGDFYLRQFNDKVYIALEDTNDKLYETDGTPANTKVLDETIGVERFLDVIDDKLFFYGDISGEGTGIIVTNGTKTGTTLLKELTVPVATNAVKVYKNELYFNGRVSRKEGEHLWKTNGTKEGTILFKNTSTGSIDDSLPRNLFIVGDELLFQAFQHGVTGVEWWKTDGTETGTVLIEDVNEGRNSFLSSGFHQLNDQLFFIGGTGDNTTSGLYKFGVDATASTKEIDSQNIKMYYANNKLFVSGLGNQEAQMIVYDILGKKVQEQAIALHENTATSIDLKQGVYIIRMQSNSGKTIIKKILVTE